jgi:hypothetical protein
MRATRQIEKQKYACPKIETEKSQLTQKVIRLMILAPSRNLNTLQTIIHRAFPALQLQPSICSVCKEQRISREPLNSLRVKFLGGSEIAVLESLVALLLESVGGGGGHEVFFDLCPCVGFGRSSLAAQGILEGSFR